MNKVIVVVMMLMAVAIAPVKAQEVMKVSQKEAPKNIVQLAVDSENLSTLVVAVKAAGLVDVLSAEGPFTVFAPTNAAFEALGDQLGELLKPENKAKLASILTYHVVAGKVMSSDLADGQKAQTVQGAKVSIDINDDGVFVDGAKVSAADVKASNGVVHIIDKVILPPADKE